MANRPRHQTIQGRTAMFGQGLTGGLGDELGAQEQEDLGNFESLFRGDLKSLTPGTAIRAGLAASSPVGPLIGALATQGNPQALRENRDEIRREIADEPYKAAAVEALGSLPTAFVAPAEGALGARGLSLGQKVLTGARAGALPGVVNGAFQGLAHSDRSSPLEALFDTAKGAATGLGIGTTLGAGGAGLTEAALRIPGMQTLAQKLMNARARLNPADALEDWEGTALMAGNQPGAQTARIARAQAMRPTADQAAIANQRGPEMMNALLDDVKARGGFNDLHIIDPHTQQILVPARDPIPPGASPVEVWNARIDEAIRNNRPIAPVPSPKPKIAPSDKTFRSPNRPPRNDQ